MDLFEHLSLIPFLLVGLAMVKLMGAVGMVVRMINHGEEEDSSPIKQYWPHTILIFACTYALVIYWWNAHTFNDFNNKPNWHLLEYLLFITPAIGLYMMVEIAIPEFEESRAGPMDMRSFYFDNSKAIWTGGLLTALSSIGFGLFLYEHPLTSPEVLKRIGFFLFLIPLVLTDNERVHKVIVTLFTIGFVFGLPNEFVLSASPPS